MVDDGQLLGRHRRRNQHRRRREIRVLRAASTTLAAVVARHPAVQRLRQDRQPAGNAGDLQLVGGLLDEQFIAPRPGRRQEDAVGIVRQSLLAAEDADERVDPVVERLHVFVGDRPVVAETIEALPPEVVGAEAQRDPPPVIRAPAEHAGSEPVELAARAVGVGLAFERPPAERRVELPELLLLGRGPAARRIIRRLEHVRLARGIPHRPGLEHDDVGPGFGEHLGGHPAAGAGANDADIVERAAADDLHGESSEFTPRVIDGGDGGHGFDTKTTKHNGDARRAGRAALCAAGREGESRNTSTPGSLTACSCFVIRPPSQRGQRPACDQLRTGDPASSAVFFVRLRSSPCLL